MAKFCKCCPFLNGRNSKKIVLLLVGLDNAGKTTAAKNLAGDIIEGVIPTVGFSSVKLKHRGMDVTIFDLGGGSQIRGIWKSYFSDVHGVIFVIDASDASRLEECKHVLENLLRNERLAGKPVLVLANKQDRPGALDQVDIVESLRLEPLVNEQKCLTLIEECSAVNYSNRNKVDPRLLNGYRWLVNQVANDYNSLNIRVEHDKKIEAEKFEARRNELRKRLGAKENGVGIPIMNGDSQKLPYKDNIIHVSPPPGVQISSSPSDENISKSVDNESHSSSITRHVRDQLERQSMKERHRMSLSKRNKILPFTMTESEKSPMERRRGTDRPNSEPHHIGLDDRLILQDLTESDFAFSKQVGKRTLPPIRTDLPLRPSTSKSLGHEGDLLNMVMDVECVAE